MRFKRRNASHSFMPYDHAGPAGPDGSGRDVVAGAAGAGVESAGQNMDDLALAGLRSGRKAVVADINAGRKARARLLSLGLGPGCAVSVVANAGYGPLLVSVGDSRLMVERGVAHKVLVRPE